MSERREIKIAFSSEHSCTLAVENFACVPTEQLYVFGTMAKDDWMQFGLQLTDRSFIVSCANFELSDDCCLVLSDSSSLFVYVHHQQPHLLVKTKPLARLLGEQQLEDCQSTVSFKKLLMDRLKREHKEKTRLILYRTQSQLSSSSTLSTPKLLPKPSESISQPTDQTDQVLSANKERLKKYMLYELNKVGILRDNPEFHVYWKSLYANCQFQLRKEISNVNLKREVLFNCVRNSLKVLVQSNA